MFYSRRKVYNKGCNKGCTTQKQFIVRIKADDKWFERIVTTYHRNAAISMVLDQIGWQRFETISVRKVKRLPL